MIRDFRYPIQGLVVTNTLPHPIAQNQVGCSGLFYHSFSLISFLTKFYDNNAGSCTFQFKPRRLNRQNAFFIFCLPKLRVKHIFLKSSKVRTIFFSLILNIRNWINETSTKSKLSTIRKSSLWRKCKGDISLSSQNFEK